MTRVTMRKADREAIERAVRAERERLAALSPAERWEEARRGLEEMERLFAR